MGPLHITQKNAKIFARPIWQTFGTSQCGPHLHQTSTPLTMKASITAAWTNMSKDYIIKTCKAFRPRLEAVIKAEGGHIEGKNV